VSPLGRIVIFDGCRSSGEASAVDEDVDTGIIGEQQLDGRFLRPVTTATLPDMS
jgi:hypothetical protein